MSNWKRGKNKISRFDLVVKIADVLDLEINALADAVREELLEE